MFLIYETTTVYGPGIIKYGRINRGHGNITDAAKSLMMKQYGAPRPTVYRKIPSKNKEIKILGPLCNIYNFFTYKYICSLCTLNLTERKFR